MLNIGEHKKQVRELLSRGELTPDKFTEHLVKAIDELAITFFAGRIILKKDRVIPSMYNVCAKLADLPVKPGKTSFVVERSTRSNLLNMEVIGKELFNMEAQDVRACLVGACKTWCYRVARENGFKVRDE